MARCGDSDGENVMALAPTIRFQIQNATGVAFAATDTISVVGKFLQITTATGVLASTVELTPIPATAGNGLANGSFYTSATIDCTNGGTTQYLQGDFLLTATLSTTGAAGNVNVIVQSSPDGGTTWAANGVGQQVGSVVFSGTGTLTGDVKM